MIPEFVTRVLVDEEYLWWRYTAYAVGGVLACRTAVLLAQQPATRHTESTASPTPARSWFFRSKTERLHKKTVHVAQNRDLLITQAEELKAAATLTRARAELAELHRELEPKPNPRTESQQERSAAALTFQELAGLVAIADLDDTDRDRLLSLIASAIAEKQS